jgi:hypothetical protein
MTLRELLEQAQNLVDEGFGDHTVIKSTDDEGNSFIPVGSIQQDRASGGPYYFDVKAEEDYDEYGEDELKGVITIW